MRLLSLDLLLLYSYWLFYCSYVATDRDDVTSTESVVRRTATDNEPQISRNNSRERFLANANSTNESIATTVSSAQELAVAVVSPLASSENAAAESSTGNLPWKLSLCPLKNEKKSWLSVNHVLCFGIYLKKPL